MPPRKRSRGNQRKTPTRSPSTGQSKSPAQKIRAFVGEEKVKELSKRYPGVNVLAMAHLLLTAHPEWWKSKSQFLFELAIQLGNRSRGFDDWEKRNR